VRHPDHAGGSARADGGARAGGSEQAGDLYPVAHLDPGLGHRRAAQHPVDGGTPGHDRHEVLVVRPGRGVGQRVRHLRPQRGLGHPGGQHPGVHVGQPLDEQLAAPGHDQVRLHDLRRRGAERHRRGRLHVRRWFQPVPFQHHDVMAGACEQQRGEEPRGAASGDGYSQRPIRPSTASAQVKPCELGDGCGSGPAYSPGAPVGLVWPQIRVEIEVTAVRPARG
jgi:hypothetical protein